MITISYSFTTACAGLDPAQTGHALHFLAGFPEDPANPWRNIELVATSPRAGLWSARVGEDLRAILKYEGGPSGSADGGGWIAVYIGSAAEAQRWAATHEAGRHPVTNHWQVVTIPAAVSASPPAGSLLEAYDDQYLLALGVPAAWLPRLRPIGARAEFDRQVGQLPSEVAGRLLDLVEGRTVDLPRPIAPDAPLTELQAASPELAVIRNAQYLDLILRQPMAKWIAFLHPSQRRLVTAESRGPVKVTGSAGTGKTVVAMHRARHLAGQGLRVLVTSYVQTICHNIEHNLRYICTDAELLNITVLHVHRLASDILRRANQSWTAIGEKDLLAIIKTLDHGSDCPLDREQLLIEWMTIIEHQGIETWPEYRAANREGRGPALTVRERRDVWAILDQLRERLQAERLTTWEGLCRLAAAQLPELRSRTGEWRYDAVIVDELQDLKPQELHLVARLAPLRNLFLVGDAGQKIYPGKVTLNTLGVDVRGRSFSLRLNYRTTEEIRRYADQIIALQVDDLDGGTESRQSTRSLLHGLDPVRRGFETRTDQHRFVADEIARLLGCGWTPDSIGVFARQANNLESLRRQLEAAKIPFFQLKHDEFPVEPAVNLGTMHRAKGLEFKVVFVVDLDDGNMPNRSAIEARQDHVVREEQLVLERQLLYVSITRARDLVYLTWAGTPSRFLAGLI
ncbi:MAG: 3'-5' exonuclease [Acidobacteriota bacterium]